MLAKTPLRGKQMTRKWVKSHADSLQLEYKRKIIKNQYSREVFFFNFKDLKGSIHKVKGIDNHTIQYATFSFGDIVKKLAKKKGIKAAKLAKKYKKVIRGSLVAGATIVKIWSKGMQESAKDPMTLVITAITYFASEYAIDMLVDELDNIIDENKNEVKKDNV